MHEIIDAFSYGVKGRRQKFVAPIIKSHESSTHLPFNEWQDAIVNALNAGRADHPLYYCLNNWFVSPSLFFFYYFTSFLY